MAKVLVSFVTRPALGSEGGVGWAFVQAAAKLADEKGEAVHIVFDARDYVEVSAALVKMGTTDLVQLHPVSVPEILASRYNDARSRESYMSWLPTAQRRVGTLADEFDVDVVHQVTFATAVLPSASPNKLAVRRVWGPLAVPFVPSHARGKAPKRSSALGIKVARSLAARNLTNVDLVIAQNELTGGFLAKTAKEVIVEPNDVVDPIDLSDIQREDDLLSVVGLLIDRKRTWPPVDAMTRPSMRQQRLQVIGNGPGRNALEQIVRRERLERRVKFMGRLSREDTTRVVERSRALVHPAVHEGAGCVVGEAATVGVPAVVFADTGAATVVRCSNDGGEICPVDGNLEESLIAGLAKVLENRGHSPRTGGAFNACQVCSSNGGRPK